MKPFARVLAIAEPAGSPASKGVALKKNVPPLDLFLKAIVH